MSINNAGITHYTVIAYRYV